MTRTFGKRLRQQREALGLTQADLAEVLGVSVSTVADYEGGKKMPRPQKLVSLAKRLNCSTDYLLGLTDVKDPVDKIAKPDEHVPDLIEYARKKYPTLHRRPISEKEAKKWNRIFEKMFEVMEEELIDEEDKKDGTNGH